MRTVDEILRTTGKVEIRRGKHRVRAGKDAWSFPKGEPLLAGPAADGSGTVVILRTTTQRYLVEVRNGNGPSVRASAERSKHAALERAEEWVGRCLRPWVPKDPKAALVKRVGPPHATEVLWLGEHVALVYFKGNTTMKPGGKWGYVNAHVALIHLPHLVKETIHRVAIDGGVCRKGGPDVERRKRLIERAKEAEKRTRVRRENGEAIMISKALKERHVGTAPQLSRLFIKALQRVGLEVGEITETLKDGKTIEFQFYRDGGLILRLTPHDVVFDSNDRVIAEALRPYLKTDALGAFVEPKAAGAAGAGTAGVGAEQ